MFRELRFDVAIISDDDHSIPPLSKLVSYGFVLPFLFRFIVN
jgi:hypothetical protein